MGGIKTLGRPTTICGDVEYATVPLIERKPLALSGRHVKHKLIHSQRVQQTN